MPKHLLPITAASLAAAYLLPRHYPELISSSPIFTFFAVFAPLIFAQIVYNVVLYPKLLSPLRHIPGPKASTFFMGEFPTIYRLPSGEPQIAWLDIPNSGLIRYLGLWNTERLFPTSPDTLREVMHTKAHIFVKPSTLGGLSTVLGKRGLFFALGEEHRHYRKMLLPSFALRHLKGLVPVFWEKALEMGNGIAAEAAGTAPAFDDPAASSSSSSSSSTSGDEEKGKGRRVDMSRWASLATLDIIGAAGFGYDFGALKRGDHANELSAAYASLLRRDKAAMITFVLNMMLPWWLIFRLPTERAKTIRKANKTIRQVCSQLIKDRRAVQLSGDQKEGDGKDILSVMLNSGEFDTPDGQAIARDQIMTFLAAGHETSEFFVFPSLTIRDTLCQGPRSSPHTDEFMSR